MNALVSIIIPTYNRASDLDRALTSVMSQSYPNWECIIIDNHSVDNTDAVVRSFGDSRIKFFKTHNHGVIAMSRNVGIRHAQGQYIAFLDSDDWWLPSKLKISLEYLENGMDIVYHDLFRVSKSHQRIFWRKVHARNVTTPVFDDLILNGNGLNNSSVIVRRNVLSKINGLKEDDRFVGAEDFQTWLEISKLTEKFKRIPKTLGYYWAGGGNVSNPSRTIKNLDAFEEEYAKDIYQLVGNKGLPWLYYAKGRAFYRLGIYESAKNALDKILFSQLDFFVALKLAWTKLVIYQAMR